MKILLLVHAFNSLSQRVFVSLRERGHEVSVEIDVNDASVEEGLRLFQPDLVVAPFLRRSIPESVWRAVTCLVVHPGIEGDRGPSALDRAVQDAEPEWGVTVLQAESEMDAGPVHASAAFRMREATKSSLYRREVADAALASVLAAVEAIEAGRAVGGAPRHRAGLRGRARPLLRQAERAVAWARDDAATVLRQVRAADGYPGLRVDLAGRRLHVYDAHPAPALRGRPGDLLATSGPAVAVAVRDGALWLGHARDPDSATPFKLPATRVLAGALDGLPEVPLDEPGGYREIEYEEHGAVGVLRFAFLNGAMGTTQCERLLAAFRAAVARPTRVLVLAGGPEFWSNGMHLNLIEAAPSAADESWRNINRIDDLAEAVIRCESHLTVAALGANAGAGGVFLARAADRVWLREGVVLNPHYKDMGNLYGSEFWTYLLPRVAGEDNARRITQARLPVGAAEAHALGLADAVLAADRDAFAAEVLVRARRLGDGEAFASRLAGKCRRRAADEAQKPLARYREEELSRMHRNFYGFDPSYHVARFNFVHKRPRSRTPVTLARHRDRGPRGPWRSAS